MNESCRFSARSFSVVQVAFCLLICFLVCSNQLYPYARMENLWRQDDPAIVAAPYYLRKKLETFLFTRFIESNSLSYF